MDRAVVQNFHEPTMDRAVVRNFQNFSIDGTVWRLSCRKPAAAPFRCPKFSETFPSTVWWGGCRRFGCGCDRASGRDAFARRRSVVRNFQKHFHRHYGGVGVAAPGVGVAVFPRRTLAGHLWVVSKSILFERMLIENRYLFRSWPFLIGLEF